MIVYEFNKNSVEIVRIAINEYQGNQYLDVRIFYNASDDNIQELLPTKKGITLSLDLLSELKTGIDKAMEMVE